MKSVSLNEFLDLAGQFPLTDVRSPGEHVQGHIPGAHNLPLFDNRERAVIGTLYRRNGRRAALLSGLEIAGAKIRDLAQGGLDVARNSGATHLLMHCWRGGLRSHSMGWLLERVDLQVTLLEGGYRSWRRAGHRQFARPLPLIVLGGLTGSGKTALLARLAASGEQVVDLELLANHRGSAFGGIGLGPQPTVEQFENRLHSRLRELDFTRRIWIEAESQLIGKVFVPFPLFRQAIAAPMIEIRVPRQRRMELLTGQYSRCPASDLIGAVQRIRKRLGGQNVQQAVAAIQSGDFARCVEICLSYYDRSYGGARFAQDRRRIVPLDIADPLDGQAVEALINLARKLDNECYSSLKSFVS